MRNEDNWINAIVLFTTHSSRQSTQTCRSKIKTTDNNFDQHKTSYG